MNPSEQTNNLAATQPAAQPPSKYQQYKGCCCKGAYEYPWLKEETFCFCCGIRCGLMALNIVSMFEGLITLLMGIVFATGLGTHRSSMGALIDCTFGVLILVFGAIGYYGAYKTKELYIRIFWYWTLGVIPFTVCIVSWAIHEFVVGENWTWVYIMSYDLVSSIAIWSYIAYKVKRFYNLVFSHYQQLSDGVKEEENKNKKQGDDETKNTQNSNDVVDI